MQASFGVLCGAYQGTCSAFLSAISAEHLQFGIRK